MRYGDHHAKSVTGCHVHNLECYFVCNLLYWVPLTKDDCSNKPYSSSAFGNGLERIYKALCEYINAFPSPRLNMFFNNSQFGMHLYGPSLLLLLVNTLPSQEPKREAFWPVYSSRLCESLMLSKQLTIDHSNCLETQNFKT